MIGATSEQKTELNDYFGQRVRRNNAAAAKVEQIYFYDFGMEVRLLEEYCAQADLVFLLEWVFIETVDREMMQRHFSLSAIVLATLIKYQNICPVFLLSTPLAEDFIPELYSEFGQTKAAQESLLDWYKKETGAKVWTWRTRESELRRTEKFLRKIEEVLESYVCGTPVKCKDLYFQKQKFTNFV